MSAHDHHDHSHHIAHPSVYIKVLLALLVLMAITVGAAYFPYPNNPFGSFLANAILLIIAVTKAILVVVYFMGLRNSSNLARIYAIGGFSWFFTLFVMFADYTTRPWEPVRGWESVAPSGMSRFRDGRPEEKSNVPQSGLDIPPTVVR